MAFLSWKPEYSVGVERIDKEHKKLIAMINKGYESVENNMEDVVVAEVCDDMRRYAFEHFSSEEELMRTHGYAAAKEHFRQHDVFRNRAVASQSMICGGTDVDPIKTFKYLGDWLVNHILVVDKELGAFLNSKGVQ